MMNILMLYYYYYIGTYWCMVNILMLYPHVEGEITYILQHKQWYTNSVVVQYNQYFIMIGSVLSFSSAIYIFIYLVLTIFVVHWHTAQKIHPVTNNTFVNHTNQDINRLYSSTSGYTLFRYINNIPLGLSI